jgi:hypothetical protein
VNVISLSLKQVNPARYGTLDHPGDSFSYDMYSQAGQAVRSAAGPLASKGFKIKKVIAVGESQSAFRMVNYVNAIHPIAHVYDGFLIHSRGSIDVGGLSQAPQPSIPTPGATHIRADIDVPVLTFETESDLTFLAYFSARQDDAKHFRLWEVAGTSHADSYQTLVGPMDYGDSPSVVDIVAPSSPLAGIIDCGSPINSGPQHFVLKAALDALNKWVRKGKAPKSAPRLEVDAGPPVTIRTDEHGVALGGIRTPQVDVPIATISGLGQPAGGFCSLFGTTTPLAPATIASLYPTHDAYVKAIRTAARKAVSAGFVIRIDATAIKSAAAASNVGG